MKISILCDNENSWIIPYIDELESVLSNNHVVKRLNRHEDLEEGDIAFFLSCESIIPEAFLALNRHNIVVHESDLPKGRGWSPLTWQVLEGKDRIPILLLEASLKVDQGQVYMKDEIVLSGTELVDGLRVKQGEKTIEMIIAFVERCGEIEGKEQIGDPSYYKRRTPDDSELDIHKTIEEQFNLLRVVDNERYPAFFKYKGKKFVIKIEEEK